LEDKVSFRRIFVENILNTDIKVHFTLLKAFENRVQETTNTFEKIYGNNSICLFIQVRGKMI
jgi:hypothetical protein